MPEPKNYLNHAQCAMLFGIEPRTITKWVNENGMPKEGRGQYNLMSIVQWRCSYLEKKIKVMENGGVDGMNQNTRLKKVSSEIKELQLAKLNRSLIDLEEIMPIIITALSNIRQTSIPFSQKVSPQLEGLNLNERSELIRDQLNELFEELSHIPDTLRRIAAVDQYRTSESIQRSETAAKNEGKRTRRSVSHTKQGKRSTGTRQVS